MIYSESFCSTLCIANWDDWEKTMSNIFACCSSCSLIVHLVQVLYYKYLVWLGEFSLSVLQFPSLCRFYTNRSRQEHNWWSYNSKLKMSLDKTYFQPRIFCWSLCKIIDLTKAMKTWIYLGPVTFLTIVVQLVTSDLWNVVLNIFQVSLKRSCFHIAKGCKCAIVQFCWWQW